MKMIFPLFVLIVCFHAPIQAQSSEQSKGTVSSAMLSLNYYYCLEKNANPGDLFENHINSLKRTAQETDLKDFKVENKALTIYKQDSCYSTSIQLSVSFIYNSKKFNILYQELNNEKADDWEFSFVLYEKQ
ncbi:hypothetical protein ABWH96_05235 [Marivirga tractuosa]|uniref:hypothetical protein n=1 Tax=Marivirga tractuosa TaxID=1006 RepID=UPI0035CFCFA8